MNTEYNDIPAEQETGIVPTVIFSIIFHIVVLVIIPLLAALFIKPAKFQRPDTFELVALPTPKAPAPVVKKKKVVEPKKVEPKKKITKPKKVEKKIVSKKQPPKKKIKPKVEEKKPDPKPDISDLDDLFADETPAAPPVSSIKTVTNFKYNRYLSNLRSRIEKHWTPSVKDSTLAVELKFTILKNGSLTALSVSKKSGKGILDTQAKRAVQLAFPMPALPSGFSGNSLSLVYTLVPYKN